MRRALSLGSQTSTLPQRQAAMSLSLEHRAAVGLALQLIPHLGALQALRTQRSQLHPAGLHSHSGTEFVRWILGQSRNLIA